MARDRNTEKIQQIRKVTVRPGEGSVIGSVVQRVPYPDGSIGVSLSIDLKTAQVPDRRYVANTACVHHEGDVVTLVFGQKRLGSGHGFRSLVVVDMHSPSIHNFLRTCARMMTSISSYMDKNRVQRAELAQINEDVPGQTVTFSSNFTGAGFTGRDACIDFYYSSAFALEVAGKGGDFVAEPVVRVQLPTPLLRAMLERLNELRDSLPDDESPPQEGEK